mmetsp:Transcript_12826/g.19306  ORF Transcript_12826/g.19306 Transcript_12826/m.19306 type:complete len:198 (+) Transcript_12826:140-733(+)|eukprot:CAMPEP_0185029494 /NCGR_PEP_ID=MMETSP1103-20130426/15832_1 /TAXON_ID=36769 /ORGANISM="Paraphysomonas bandaiensis, Strain Caron Lab Isolate" /LENGTH=197 /DNA_ID=CAMNT_0027564261 /DNA_START=53 /DNA_END=646 /DNA_ORIENTATION=-
MIKLLSDTWEKLYETFIDSTFKDCDISDEKMEEYRMTSSFEPRDIARLRKAFLVATNGNEEMDKECFLNIPCIAVNPLKERVACVFGFDQRPTIDFIDFLASTALFNCPGRKDLKLKTAYKLQDMDNDGTVSRSDLRDYIKVVTNGNLVDVEVNEIVSKVISECSSDPNLQVVSFHDFQRVVAKSDFETKLHLKFYV